jgi:hypothetical protein
MLPHRHGPFRAQSPELKKASPGTEQMCLEGFVALKRHRRRIIFFGSAGSVAGGLWP